MSSRGYIKAVVVPRGFGFISSSEQPKDVFFHCTGLVPPLEFNEQLEQVRVEFDTRETDKGLQAINVRLA